MYEPYGIQTMPQSVSVARLCMWIQTALGLFGLLLLFVLLANAPAGAVGVAVLVALAVPLLAIVMIGFLASQVRSRRSWVRITGLIVEFLIVLLGVWELMSGGTFGTVLGMLLAAVVFAQLCRSSSAMWFDR
ncbi:hypothetical protein AB0I81_08700 [Nonomuraea sp. NPDC050404]|uniref:hypothetical protein n=1 Tax=Nonomuraea sp. NPDC050404 TaxID=3155783 RepID=UPI0033F38E21